MLNLHLLVKVGVWITPTFENGYIEFYSLNYVLPLYSVRSITNPFVPTIRSPNIWVHLVL